MRLREHEGIIPGRIDILYCKPDAITIEEGYNVRDLTTPEARAELDELKESVKANGILTPLKVRFNGQDIILVEGHRRRTVALELIAEFNSSGGAAGRMIEAVPIFPEAPGTTEVERDFGLELSNSGTRLKPLELANLFHRLHTVRGLPVEEIAKRRGSTVRSVQDTMKLRAMPEPVKEQVRAGDIAAGEAAKLLKNLPKGTDPVEAAKLIAANKEENKRLGVGAKKNHKVTAKTLKRDAKPKTAEAPKEDPKPVTMTEPTRPLDSPAPGETPAPVTTNEAAALATDEALGASNLFETVAEEERPSPVRAFPVETMQPPGKAFDFDRDMFAIIARLATIGEDNCLSERGDDETIPVPAEVIKAADRAYRARISDEIAA